MALGESVRELLIKIGVLGGAEARAEMDAQAASIEKVGAAAAGSTAATEASAVTQANALKDVDAALTRASAQALNFAEASKVGGKVAADEYLFLQNSVGALSTAIQKAQAVGAVVPPATLKSLEDMKVSLAAATAAVAPHVAAVGGVSKAHSDTKLQVDLARESLGQWGRALGAATESTNPFISAIGRFLLPLAAAAGGLVLFNKVAGEMQQRGVDISTVGDKWSSVMDGLAVALGGTSKAAGEAEKAFAATQAKMDDLSGTQREFATGADLLVGLGLDVAKSFDAWTDSTQVLGGALQEFPTFIAQGGQAVDLFNTRLNEIRVVSPRLAEQFATDFKRVTQAAIDGEAGAGAALTKLNADESEAANKARAFVTEFADHYKKFPEAAADLGKFTAGLDEAVRHMETFGKSGMNQRQVYEAMKPELTALAQLMNKYGAEIANLAKTDPVIGANIAKLRELAGAAPAVTDKIKEFNLAQAEQKKSFDNLVGSIDAAVKKDGDYRAAVTAARSEIDSRITSLEKQKSTLTGLTAAQEAQLAQLLRMRKEYSDVSVEQDKFNKFQEDGVKKAHDLSKSYEDLTKARQKDQEAIEKHRVEFIAGLDAELKKAVESGNAQVKALDDQHKAMEIDDHEYAQSVNQIFADMAAAKRAAVEAEDKANAEAAQKEKEHQKTYEEAAGEIAKAMEKVNETLSSAKQKQAEYDAATATSLERVRGQWEKTTETVHLHASSYAELADKFNAFPVAVAAGSERVNSDIGNMISRLGELKKALDEVNSAADAAFGGTGGGAPEQFGPPTPAPEPTGSAPGSEFTT